MTGDDEATLLYNENIAESGIILLLCINSRYVLQSRNYELLH